MTIRCYGLDFDQLRPLTEAEVECYKAMLRQSRSTRVRWTFFLCCIPLCLALAAGLATAFHLSGFQLLYCLPFLVAAGLIPIDYSKQRYKWILPATALKEGVVEVYRLSEGSKPTVPGCMVIERLPRSQYILTKNGELNMAVDAVASLAGIAEPVSKSAQSAGYIKYVREKRVILSKRSLSTLEKSQIELNVNRHEAKADALWILLMCLLLLSVTHSLVRRDFDLTTLYVGGIFVGFSLFGLISLNMARRLRKDVEQGELVTVKLISGKTAEICPNSGLVWSIDGNPALWRYVSPFEVQQ